MSFLDETGLTYLWKKIKLAAIFVRLYVETHGINKTTTGGKKPPVLV